MEQEKAKKPFGRSLSDFGNLKYAEKLMLISSKMGGELILGRNVPRVINFTGPLKDYVDIELITIRADFIRFLLLGGDFYNPVNERGIILKGAYVEGKLDISGVCINFGFSFVDCYFSKEILARNSIINGSIYLTGSYLGEGVDAARLKCTSNLSFDGNFHSAGFVRISGAHIDGDIDFGGAYLDCNKSGVVA